MLRRIELTGKRPVGNAVDLGNRHGLLRAAGYHELTPLL